MSSLEEKFVSVVRQDVSEMTSPELRFGIKSFENMYGMYSGVFVWSEEARKRVDPQDAELWTAHLQERRKRRAAGEFGI